MTIDPIEFSQQLIRCPSVTPTDAGALDVLETALESLGFTCHRLPYSEDGTPDVDNLYARYGIASPNFCFAGHTDVVPVGNTEDWSVDPFAADIIDGRLFGRGTCDMKCAIACFVAATSRLIEQTKGTLGGSISFLITGDEEGPAINGTRKMLDWLKSKGEVIDQCLVGEPTSIDQVGDMAKIGRRGSMNATITVYGTQGHVAYPHLADNPIPRLVNFLTDVDNAVLDVGTNYFQPSNLEITNIDIGNDVTNIIPAKAKGRINIRFNDQHSGASLSKLLESHRQKIGGKTDMSISISGESFLTPPGQLSELIATSIKAVTGLDTDLSTTGGTSDARFIKDVSPVAELGLQNTTAHKVDENVAVKDIEVLADIYEHMLQGFFGSPK
ncbi:MAG: succinyl-diaminopimelate desuccinylase [Rhodospirillales bacterium]|nr:succinyl-diaminopimelate desuccinylase [Rhodospirillales bacterium]